MSPKSNSNTTGSWLKLGEAARAFGVSEITLRRRVKSGKLPYDFRAGKYFVFVPDDVSQGPQLNSIDSEELAKPVFSESSLDSSGDRLQTAADILRPYAQAEVDALANSSSKLSQPEPRETSEEGRRVKPGLTLKGPSTDQVVSILKTELAVKEKEITELRRQLADQKTLIDVLEAAYQEVQAGGGRQNPDT